jgi:hypothetical protein
LRLIDPPRGVDADRPRLLEVLRPLLVDGSKVLIAGSADAGLAECVLDAADEQAIALTILDVCETPLHQSAVLLTERARGELRTVTASITEAPVGPPVDVIVAHSVLSFLSPDELPRAGTFLHDSLSNGGHLVMTTGVGTASARSDAASFRRHVLSELQVRSIPLPEAEAAFGLLLDQYMFERSNRTNPFATIADLSRWLEAAELMTDSITALRRGSGYAFDGTPIARVSDGFLVVARRGSSS